MTRKIRAEVDQGLIAQAAGLFKGDAESVLHELVQNARRAHATHLWLDWEAVGEVSGHREDPVRVRIRDDGYGCDAPERFLRLGGSGVRESHAHEHPAGMGCAVLAGQGGVVARSWTGKQGWRIGLERAAFEGRCEVEVHPLEREEEARLGCHGTEVEYTCRVIGGERALEKIALDVLAPVSLAWTGNGKRYEAGPWLEEVSLHTEVHDGIRYGVQVMIRDKVTGEGYSPRWARGDANVYGAVAYLGLPKLEETRIEWKTPCRTVEVRVEACGSGALKLTLPQRKEVVAGPEVDAIKEKAFEVLARGAARLDPPFIAGGQAYVKVKAATGIELATGERILREWHPPWHARAVDPENAWVVEDWVEEKMLRIALGQAATRRSEGDPVLYEGERRLRGVPWYDALRKTKWITVEHGDGERLGQTAGLLRVPNLVVKLEDGEGAEWTKPIGFTLVSDDANDLIYEPGNMDLWTCAIDRDRPPSAAEIEEAMELEYDPGHGLDEEGERRDRDAFRREVHELATLWTGGCAEEAFCASVEDIIASALDRESNGLLHDRAVTVHVLPEEGVKAVVDRPWRRKVQKDTWQGRARTSIEGRLRRAGATLRELALRNGMVVTAHRPGVRLERCVDGASGPGSWTDYPSPRIGIEMGDDPDGHRKARRLLEVAAGPVGSWWAGAYHAEQGFGEPLRILDLPVPERLLELEDQDGDRLERMSQAGERKPGEGEESPEAFWSRVYNMSEDDRSAILGSTAAEGAAG